MSKEVACEKYQEYKRRIEEYERRLEEMLAVREKALDVAKELHLVPMNIIA